MRKRTLIKILVWISALIIVVVAANSILKSVVEKKLKASLNQFQPYIQAGFSKAQVNLFAASVQLDSVYVLYNPELQQAHEHKIFFSVASISGIDFFKLITAKKISAGSLKLKNAAIRLDSYLLDKNDTLPANIFDHANMPFKNIFFSLVEVNNAEIFEQNDNKIDAVSNSSISLTDVQIPKIDTAFSKDSIQFSNVQCDLNDVQYKLSAYYKVRLQKFHLSSKDSLMRLDTLKLIPLLSKFELGEKLGRQADHITASINKIEVSGLQVKALMQKKLSHQQ